MEKFNFQLYRIIDPEFFDEVQPVYEKATMVTPKVADHVADAYEHTYSEILPGIAQDGTMAGMLKVTIPEEIKGAMIADINACILNTSEDVFGKDSTICCFYTIDEKSTVYYLLTMPLKQRRPEVAKYMDRKQKDTLSDTYISVFDDEFAKILPEYTRKLHVADMTPEEKGYQPALLKYTLHAEKKTDYTIMHYTTSDHTSQVQTITPKDVITSRINNVIDYFTTIEHNSFKEAQKKQMTEQVFMNMLESYIARTFPDTPEQDLQYMLDKLHRWAYGMYILEPLVDDDDISDIMVVKYDNIRVKVKNRRYTSNVKFLNQHDYDTFVWGLAARNNFDLNESAIHVFSDVKTHPDFRMRMNLTTPWIVSDESYYYHIRKIAKHKRNFQYLLDNNMLDQTIMNYLVDRARYGSGMIFTGKGASGKTTLMNALLDKIGYDKSGLVIQESEELFSSLHPHLMFEHINNSGSNPKMHYHLEHLARNGLLTDLDYFIIGEIKGQEAADFMMAADTGHRCWCSVHAPTAYDAMDKLADYVMSATRYDFNTVNKMLSHLGTVVFMKDFQVCEVVELKRWDAATQRLIYEPIYLRPGMEHPDFAVA